MIFNPWKYIYGFRREGFLTLVHVAMIAHTCTVRIVHITVDDQVRV